MAEHSDTDAAAARLEAALERIARAASHLHPRQGEPEEVQDRLRQAEESAAARERQAEAVAARLDALIAELRGALAGRNE